MRASRLWPRLALGCLLWSASAVALAQAQTIASPAPQTQSPPQAIASAPVPDDEMEEIEELEEEVGDRDPTYLRTRLVFRYDYKRLRGPSSIDRFRLLSLIHI